MRDKGIVEANVAINTITQSEVERTADRRVKKSKSKKETNMAETKVQSLKRKRKWQKPKCAKS
jgi:hypothetical protein